MVTANNLGVKPNAAQSIYGQLGLNLAGVNTTAENTGSGVWEDLSRMQQTFGHQLVRIRMEVEEAHRWFHNSEYTNTEARITIDGIRRDVNSFFHRALALYNRHKEKHGLVGRGDEYAEYMAIGMDYFQLNQDFNTTLFTPVTTLTEHVNRLKQQQNTTNPNVVTDVPFKAAETV